MATKRKDWKAEWEAVQKESRKLAKRANQRLVRLEQYSEREGLSEILKFSYKKAGEYIESHLGKGKSGKLRYKENVKLYDIETDKMGFIGAKQKGLTKEAQEELYKQNVMIQRNRIKAMKEFLESDTSTLGQSRSGPKTQGIRKVYDKRTNTINEKFLKQYGLEMTDKDLKRFFESKKQAKLEKIVGSRQMFVVASVIKKYNLQSNKRDLERFMKSHIDLEQYKDINEDDIKARKGESYRDYLTRMQDFVKYTDDEVLNTAINNALKEGINAKNIFI